MNIKGGGPEKFGRIRSFLYERLAQPSIEPLHRRIASEIPIARGRLLDVGCGPGGLDRLIAASRPDLTVVGLDESEAMTRRAARGPRLPNLEFRTGAVERLSFREEFDFVISVLSFHHWEEPEAGLAAVCRALKPGGRFWIYEGDPEASSEDLRLGQKPLWGWLRLPEPLLRKGLRGHGFTLGEAESLVRPVAARAGFEAFRAARSGALTRMEMNRPPP